jgi:tetrahydromethanopterin S-methyltransferase subunit E
MLSVIPTFFGCLTIYYLRKVSVLAGLTVYTVIISLWVAFLLQYVLGLPYLITFLYLLIGVGVVTIGLGYILYKTLLKFGGEKLWHR